jgi:hypothetical protein
MELFLLGKAHSKLEKEHFLLDIEHSRLENEHSRFGKTAFLSKRFTDCLTLLQTGGFLRGRREFWIVKISPSPHPMGRWLKAG